VAHNDNIIPKRVIGEDMANSTARGNQKGGMLTVHEVSQLLHIHPNTLRRWSDQGILKAYRIGPRGDRRFQLEDVTILLFEKAEDVVAGANTGTSNAESKSEDTS